MSDPDDAMSVSSPSASLSSQFLAVGMTSWRGPRVRTLLMVTMFIGVVSLLSYRAGTRLAAPDSLDADSWTLQGFRQSIYYPVVAFIAGHNPYDVATHTSRYPAAFFPLYSPITLLVHLPFGLVPFGIARLLYYALVVVLTLTLAELTLRMTGRRRSIADVCGLAALVLLSRPGQMNLLLGQSSAQIVIGAYLALRYARARSAQMWLAGLGLALTTIRPTFGAPLAILLLAQGHVRAVLAGFALSTLATGVVTAGLIGSAGGVGPFVASLAATNTAMQANEAVNLATNWSRIDTPALIARLFGWQLNTVGELIIGGVMLAVAALCLMRPTRSHEASRDRSLALTCLTVLTCSYHQAYDLLLLVLPLTMLVVGDGGVERRGVRWLLIGLLALPAVNYLASESAIRLLPLAGTSWRLVTSVNGAALLAAWLIYIAQSLTRTADVVVDMSSTSTQGQPARIRVTSVAVQRGWLRKGLLASVLLAAVLRVAGVIVVGHPEMRQGEFSLGSDEPSFHNPAAALATTGAYSREAGGPPTAFRPPGIILPLAALYAVFGASPYVGLAYVVLCGLAVVVVVYTLARSLSGDARVATISALVAAALPTLVFTSTGIWSEPQAVLITLLWLWLLVREDASDGGLGKWVAIGLCGSLAYLTRPSAGGLLPFAIVWVLRSGRGWKRVANTLALTAALVLPIALWGLRNRLVLGEFLVGPTVAGEALWGSNNAVTAGVALPALQFNGPFDLYQEAHEGRYLGSWVPMKYIPGWDSEAPNGAPELTVYHHQVAATRAFIREHPWSWVRLIGYKLVRLVTLEPYAPSVTGDVGSRHLVHRAVTLIEYWFMLVWGMVGIRRLLATNRRAGWWFACFAVASLAHVLVTYANPRFLLPVTSVLIVPVAVGLVHAYDGWLRRLSEGSAP